MVTNIGSGTVAFSVSGQLTSPSGGGGGGGGGASASEVWEDTFSGGDFDTAGSVGGGPHAIPHQYPHRGGDRHRRLAGRHGGRFHHQRYRRQGVGRRLCRRPFRPSPTIPQHGHAAHSGGDRPPSGTTRPRHGRAFRRLDGRGRGSGTWPSASTRLPNPPSGGGGGGGGGTSAAKVWEDTFSGGDFDRPAAWGRPSCNSSPVVPSSSPRAWCSPARHRLEQYASYKADAATPWRYITCHHIGADVHLSIAPRHGAPVMPPAIDVAGCTVEGPTTAATGLSATSPGRRPAD